MKKSTTNSCPSGQGRDARRRYVKNPKTSTTPTMDQPQGHDPEEDHIQHPKKSILYKMRDGVNKLRQSLQMKKHEQNRDTNATPSWGVSLDDDEDAEDHEYFGAPMYESELAPEGHKETAEEHHKQVTVVPQKHMLATNVMLNMDQGKNQKPPDPIMTSMKNVIIIQEKEKRPSPSNEILTKTMTSPKQQ